MRVHATLTEEDFLEYTRFYFREIPGGKKLLANSQRVVWVLVFLFPALVGYILSVVVQVRDGIFMFVVMLVIMAALSPLCRRRIRKQIEVNSLKALRSDRNALFHLPCTIEITPGHLTHENELMYARISWKAVENVFEQPGYLFILLGSAMGTYIIPLRSFDSPGDAAAFAIAARGYFLEAHPTG
jgi:hypothetical protein